MYKKSEQESEDRKQISILEKCEMCFKEEIKIKGKRSLSLSSQVGAEFKTLCVKRSRQKLTALSPPPRPESFIQNFNFLWWNILQSDIKIIKTRLGFMIKP